MAKIEVFSLVVLLSGKGSNLQAILNAIENGQLHAKVSLVISDQAHAQGLLIAQNGGIPTVTLNKSDYQDRQSFDCALVNEIEKHAVDLVVLAGFMRILGKTFVEHFSGKLINIHPSLLPAYKGLHTHRRVLDAREKIHGCSVHYVSAELDGGPVIAQARCEIGKQDTEQTLKEKVQGLEHQLYPKVIQWIVEKRVCLQGGNLIIETVLQEHDPTRFLE